MLICVQRIDGHGLWLFLLLQSFLLDSLHFFAHLGLIGSIHVFAAGDEEECLYSVLVQNDFSPS